VEEGRTEEEDRGMENLSILLFLFSVPFYKAHPCPIYVSIIG
jgi:hypothetical protein